MKLSKGNKYFRQRFKNLSLISLLTSLGCGLTSTAIAEIVTTVLFQPPPESEQPEDTESAASRQNGQCFQDLVTSQPKNSSEDLASLIPVVPSNNFAYTISDRPDFWIYLPETSATQAILSLKEGGTTPHWQQSVNLTGESGIMGISLSDDAPALETGKNYQWAVTLVCENRPNPNDPVVTSWIERVDESQITSGINYATELDRAADYAQKGIWYDALNILVAQKNATVSNWRNIWVQYLQSGGLNRIANEEIISE